MRKQERAWKQVGKKVEKKGKNNNILDGNCSVPISNQFNFLKGGFYLIRTEIWSSFKRELLRLKWVGNTTTQLTPRKKAPGS